MQFWRNIEIDWTIGIISAAILLTLGQFVQSATQFAAPPAVGLTLASIIVIMFFTSLTNQHRWSPFTTLVALVSMLGISVLLAGISNQLGSAAIATAWTGLGLAFAVVGVMGIGSASPALQFTETSQSKSDDTVTTSLEEQLLASLSAPEELESADETVVQSWTRLQTVTGEERLEGTIQITFANDQRVFNLHLPIYPAFQIIPEVWCETETGDCLAEVDTKQTYGSRIRVRRTGSDLSSRDVNLSVVMTTSHQNLADAA